MSLRGEGKKTLGFHGEELKEEDELERERVEFGSGTN